MTAPAPIERAGHLGGLYVLAGVSGAAARLESEWDSTIGGHLGFATYNEEHAISLVGLELGLSQYGERAGGRAWIAPAIGTRRLGPGRGILIGASAGLSAEWDRTDPPKWGAVGTLWLFAGIVPTISVGRHQRVGTFVELGIRLTFPAARLSRRPLN